MKTLKHLALCLAAAFIATGCSNDENEPVNNAVKKGTPATFNMTISNGANTRTSTNSGRVITWRAGDEVGIFAIGGSGEPQINCKYVYNAETLMWEAKTLDNGIMLEEGANYTFYAYYPYTDNVKAAKAAILNVYSNQSITQEGGNSNYDLSDVLLSQSTVDSYNNGEITLNYTHAYAMVEVLIAGDKIGEDGPSQVVLKNVVTDASIDLTTQEINTLGAPQDVIMARVEGDENNNTFLYRAIVPAQKMTKGSTLLEVYGVNGGKNYTFKAPENKDIAYDKGKFFRMEVMIGEVEAGIKFPGGNIDPWESTPGVNLEGEELKVNLITMPISNLTNDNFLEVTAVDYFQDGDFWYFLKHKDDETMTATLNNDATGPYISFKSEKPTGSWFKSSIGYHHKGDFQATFYKLTFKFKADKENGEMRIFIRSANDSKQNIFFCNSLRKSANVGAKKLTQEEVASGEWIDQTLYYDFTTGTTNTGGTPKAEEIFDLSDQIVPFQQFELKFVSNNNNNGKNVTFQIKDVKLEPISLEEIPEDQRPK